MVINHLVTGMILQVGNPNQPKPSCLESKADRVLKICPETEDAWCEISDASPVVFAGFETKGWLAGS